MKIKCNLLHSQVSFKDMRNFVIIGILCLFATRLCAQVSPALDSNYILMQPIPSLEQVIDTFLYPSNIIGVPIGDTVLIANVDLLYPNLCRDNVTTVNWYVAPRELQIPFRWIGADNYSPPRSADIFFFPSTTDTITQYFRFENIYDAFHHPECPSSKDFVVGVRAYGIKSSKSVLAKQVNRISLYPNPASSVLTLSCSEYDRDATIQIFDCLGNNIAILSNIEDKKITISVSRLPKGFYTVQLRMRGNFLSQKFIVSE